MSVTSHCQSFRGPQIGFSELGIYLFETRDSGFENKIGASFGIESMRGRWDAKNNLGITGLHGILGRDYGIEENPTGNPPFPW